VVLITKEKLYAGIVLACISYGVPKVIELLSQVTLWTLTHWF
jgi:hypothetical protein